MWHPYEEPLQDGEEYLEIDPAELQFVFGLSTGECHKRKTGKCSLDRVIPYLWKDCDGDAVYTHCRQIYKSIRENGIDQFIDIIKFSCGHYGFNDGQHRVCIARRKNFKLWALITSLGDACDICSGIDRDGRNSVIR